MIFARDNEIKALNKLYSKNISEAVVFYGNSENCISQIVKKFIIDKDFFYYDAAPVDANAQLKLFYNSISDLISNKSIPEISYHSIIQTMLEVKCEKRVIVINNFQNMVKSSLDFIREVISCIHDKWSNQPVLFLFICENPYWVENQMAVKLEDYAFELSGLIKVNDLKFIDFVRYFANYNLNDLVTVYSIIGGRNNYLKEWDPKISVKANIEKSILSKDSYLYNKGLHILPDELREHIVYNTILMTIASGKEKLNDIHKETGYSRAKISVYLKNLYDFDLIEKIDSFDSAGRENAQKGIYRIKDRYVSFYFKYIMPHISEIDYISSEKYYKKYIEPDLMEYSSDAFRTVCVEYLSLLNRMNKLPFSFNDFERWVGKVGTIDIVAEDNKGNNLIGLCNFQNEFMTYEDYEWLIFCVKQAKLSDDVVYLFSGTDFDDNLKAYAKENSNIYLIDSRML